ncbi:hypothetical protein [Falsirhodobacter sp. 20TX0035]|uniref:hypothetical protein n=1 Tax=Falsirhodobacter sp. 20TX0035 TaxID=3022019 RepID=UPI00232AC620|nr:hypothetical protein [Falsirhodobacter sp. 20TX0035]MDB6454896.1 hypothetical protein [Falsirhodobacter sp. 20TX0035]
MRGAGAKTALLVIRDLPPFARFRMCPDIVGFLKYGGSYWPRKRRYDRWRAERISR